MRKAAQHDLTRFEKSQHSSFWDEGSSFGYGTYTALVKQFPLTSGKDTDEIVLPGAEGLLPPPPPPPPLDPKGETIVVHTAGSTSYNMNIDTNDADQSDWVQVYSGGVTLGGSVVTHGGTDVIRVSGNFKMNIIDAGSGDDYVVIGNGASVNGIYLRDGDDTLEITDGRVGEVSTGEGDNSVTLTNGSTATQINCLSGNDTVTITDGSAVNNVSLHQGDDVLTVDLDALDGWPPHEDGSFMIFDGGSGLEEEGDTVTITFSGDFQEVTYDPGSGTYTVTLENGEKAVFSNFENINWPENFDEDTIVIIDPEAEEDECDGEEENVSDPDLEPEEGFSAQVAQLFFDDETSKKMIEDQDAKNQDEGENEGFDLFI